MIARKHRLTAQILAGAMLFPGPAGLAQPATPPTSGSIMIATPVDANAIPLPGAPNGSIKSEQWFEDGKDSRSVRNVTAATLTPVLPDPAKATGAAVIVAPGGGFAELEMDGEGYQVAKRLADQGIAAFVLKYCLHPVAPNAPPMGAPIPLAVPNASSSSRMGSATGAGGQFDLTIPPLAQDDAKAAIRLVRSRAAEWHVDPKRVGFMGFSAGAILALWTGLLDDSSVSSDFIMPIYGFFGKRPVPVYAPPMFAAIALDDPITTWTPDLDLFEAWHAAGRPVEAHFYETGGHGFASATKGTTSDLWFTEAIAWMKSRGLLRPIGSPTIIYNTAMPLGLLLQDPAATATVERHLPGLSDAVLHQMSGLSLQSLHRHAPTVVSEQALVSIEADLAKMGTK